MRNLENLSNSENNFLDEIIESIEDYQNKLLVATKNESIRRRQKYPTLNNCVPDFIIRVLTNEDENDDLFVQKLISEIQRFTKIIHKYSEKIRDENTKEHLFETLFVYIKLDHFNIT